MFNGKPIIGLAGGIGSGKSFVAKIFGEMGCFVIDSDAQARAAYNDPAVQNALREWWGESVFGRENRADRSAIAKKIFDNPEERNRLERLVHPWIDAERKRVMELRRDDSQVLAFVWDTPLLFETGLYGQCDAVVFVESTQGDRLNRVILERGWSQSQWEQREKLQWPLDRKKKISHYVVVNTADASTDVLGVRGQIREILSQILTNR